MIATPTIKARLQEIDGPQAERFVKAYDRSRAQLTRLTNRGVRDIERVLRDFRVEIAGRLALLVENPAQPFTIRVTPQITTEIRRSIDDLVRTANPGVQASLEKAFDLGSSVTASAFTAAGVPITFPTLSPSILASLGATTENVLTELGTRLGDRILREIRLSAAGLEPSSAAIGRIDDFLRTSTEVRRGLRRRIGFGFQAESIVRTEIPRIFSNAQQAASEQISQSVPDLRKRWVTTLRKRRGHREAEARYATGGEIGPILVKNRFRVTDFSRSDFNVGGFWTTRTEGGAQRVYRGKPRARSGRPITDRMLFPRDPAGSAGNVVNCTCIVLEVVPSLERVGNRMLGVLQQGGT